MENARAEMLIKLLHVLTNILGVNEAQLFHDKIFLYAIYEIIITSYV